MSKQKTDNISVSETHELSVFGEKMTVSPERVEYNRLRKLFAELSEKQCPQIEAEIDKQGEDVDAFRRSGDAWARGFINGAADLAVDVLMSKGCYDFDKETFVKKYLDASPWERRFAEFCTEIDAIDSAESDREEARKARTFEAKNRWSGVGDEAIKEADNRNFWGGVNQGIANTVGRGFYAIANSMSKDKIFKKHRDSLVKGIQLTVRTAVDELVDCLAANGHPLPGAKVDKESREKAERIFNNLKSGKLPPEAEHGARMQILALNPYLFDFYEHIYLNEGDKSGELCETAAFFGFSMEQLKEAAFKKQLGTCEFKTAEDTEAYRAKAERIGKELRYDPKEVLADCDARLKRFEELTRTTLNILYETREAAQAAYGDRQAFYRGIEATVKAADQEKFYLNEAIPPKRLANARAVFPIHAQETVIAFVDTTLFGSGKTGLAVSRWGMRWANLAEKSPVKAMSWEAFAKLPECPKRVKSRIDFSSEAIYDNAGSGVDDEKMFGVIKELYDFCKAATFFTDRSPEEPPEDTVAESEKISGQEAAPDAVKSEKPKTSPDPGTSTANEETPTIAMSGSMFQRCRATYIDGMKKYVDFKGRMATEDYVRFLVVNCIVGVVVTIISCGTLAPVYIAATILPVASATVRRLNDFKLEKDGFK